MSSCNKKEITKTTDMSEIEINGISVQQVEEDCNTSECGFCTNAEGCSTKAFGDCSHAEGSSTNAFGYAAHAEGTNTKAYGEFSHAEGNSTSALGNNSHAEGISTITYSVNAHAEGNNTKVRGNSAHAEGVNSEANGDYSHAEGVQTIANSYASKTEGAYTTTRGSYAHAEGYSTNSNGSYAHSEGYSTVADNSIAHAEGAYNTAKGYVAHAEGYSTTSSGSYAHTEGYSTVAEGTAAHAEGAFTAARASYSHAEGYNTDTKSYVGSNIMGLYGDADENYSWFLAGGDSSNRALAAKISYTGNAYIRNTWNSGGLGYAEMFSSGNQIIDPGYFVTLNGENIQVANETDAFILGVTTALSGFVSNNTVLNKGINYAASSNATASVREDMTLIPELKDKDGAVIIPEQTLKAHVKMPYMGSAALSDQSNNFATVAVVGQVLVFDDGTSKVNGYCMPNNQGIATEAKCGYRIMKRIADNQILILFR